MANSNMTFQLFLGVIYFGSFITMIKWRLWFLQMFIKVSLELIFICIINVSIFTNSFHMKLLMFIIIMPEYKFLLAKLANIVLWSLKKPKF